MTNNIKIIYKEFKTALNKLKYPDSWFWARYTTNPYSGCGHACIYCDARSNRYYLEQDFENEVIVKSNFDVILEQTIRRSRTLLPDVVGPGGVSDAYQPIEAEIKNTQKLLEVFQKYKFPINIATKSKLITRDIDILQKIAKDTWCTVGFSITSMDQDLVNFLEPFSSPTSERLKALKYIKENAPNIQVGTYFMPIIPFLEDDDDNIEGVIKESKNAGADFILFSPGLTLRDSQANFFIDKLKNSKYKEVVKPILDLFKGKNYPPAQYARKMHSTLYKLANDYKIPIRVKRWIPKDYRKWNYKVSEHLLNEEYIGSVVHGKSNNNMKWAGLNLNNLKESILDVYKRGALKSLDNFNSEVINIVEPFIKNAKDLTKKRGIEHYL
ncbi:MAG: radical SAM protein [Candidatus Lokiarchaeota archaeon]|nr:radical SAM protein [Candidatus Lokiarchaeota archaeon]